MLFFRSEEMLNAWCAESHLPRREIIPLAKIWELASAWYGDRLERTRSRSRREMREILVRLGLTGPFWELPD
jgi:hypothetical protein